MCLKEEMVADLRYFISLELEVDSLKSQLENQQTQFSNEIDRLSKEYYYADHMNAILGVYTELDKMKNDKSFKVNQSKEFCKECEQYFEVQDLKSQLQDKGIAISELKKLIEKLKGKSVDTKFGKSLVIRQPNAFKSQRPSILGKPTIFSTSLERKDFSMSKSVTKNNVSNDFSKPVTAQILPPNKKSILKNTNVLAPGIPKLKSNPIEDRVMLNNSQGKKQEVEHHRRNVKFSKNETSVTVCNDSLNAKTSNVNFVCATCGKCVLNDKHDICVLKSLDGVNSRTKMPIVMPVSTREPKRTINQSVAKPLRKTVASESNQKHRNSTRKLYERISKACSWWYLKFTPSGYNWKPKSKTGNVKPNVSMPLGNAYRTANVLDPMTSRHFTVSNTSLSSNSFAARRDCPINRQLWGNDLLTCSHGTDLYSITFQDTTSPNPICLMAKATLSQARLWHRRLSHLNFNTTNLLSKNDIVTTPSSKRRLQLLHMNLCGPMRVASINGKRYVLVIVDDYSRFTWTHFLRSKDETPEVLIDFLRLVQKGLHAQVRIVRTDKGTEFLNKTLHAYFASEGILHQTSVARTPKQNGVVEKQNCTLVEAARTMLSAAKVPLFFWAEAISTSCFTRNRSLIIPRHEKTPYHIINDRKPSVKFFHIFGSLCYIVRDGKNLDKMKEKGDACVCVGYSTQSRSYRVFNKRTRVIVETIHVNFDELPQMASDHVSSDPVLECPTTALEHDSLSLGPQCQENVPHADRIVTMSNELDLLFSLMFAEFLNGSTLVVSKPYVVATADAHNQRQQHNTTPLNTQTTPEPPCQVPTQAPTVTSTEKINQAEMIEEYAQVENDEFINIFSTPIQDRGETSFQHDKE
nr:hypothetical protein [Tanacetum cinerariifolium]